MVRIVLGAEAQAGDTLVLDSDFSSDPVGGQVAAQQLTADDIARGYVDLIPASPRFGEGHYDLSAKITDPSGNTLATSGVYETNIQPDGATAWAARETILSNGDRLETTKSMAGCEPTSSTATGNPSERTRFSPTPTTAAAPPVATTSPSSQAAAMPSCASSAAAAGPMAES
jgi:hypothetical protein